MAADRNDNIVPSVGIFWGVPVSDQNARIQLVIDRTSTGEAEIYGDFLTHPRGHYEVWESWRRLGPTGLKLRRMPISIAFHEYEDFPRGRIVFDTKSSTFVIYADCRLQGRATIEDIVRSFALAGERINVRPDSHYR